MRKGATMGSKHVGHEGGNHSWCLSGTRFRVHELVSCLVFMSKVTGAAGILLQKK